MVCYAGLTAHNSKCSAMHCAAARKTKWRNWVELSLTEPPSPTRRWCSSRLDAPSARPALPLPLHLLGGGGGGGEARLESPLSPAGWLPQSIISLNTSIITDGWLVWLAAARPHPPTLFCPPPSGKAGLSFFFRERLQVHLTHAKTPEGGDPVFWDLRFLRTEGKITSVIIRARGLFFLWNASGRRFLATNFATLMGTCEKQIEGCRSRGRGVCLLRVCDSSLRTKQQTK